jgi:hypothetical protein
MTMLELVCPHCSEEIREPIGNVAAQVAAAVEQLRTSTKGELEPTRAALAELAIELARAFDYASDGRGIAAMAKELHAILDALKVGTDDDAARAEYQHQLSTPVGHTTQPPPANAGPSRRQRHGRSRTPTDALATESAGHRPRGGP